MLSETAVHKLGDRQEASRTLGSMVSKVFPLCASIHSPFICKASRWCLSAVLAVSVVAPSTLSLRVAHEYPLKF